MKERNLDRLSRAAAVEVLESLGIKVTPAKRTKIASIIACTFMDECDDWGEVDDAAEDDE